MEKAARILSLLATLLVASNVFASETSRIRIAAPYETSVSSAAPFEADPGHFAFPTSTPDGFSFSGGSFWYIFSSGFGVGYSDLRAQATVETRTARSLNANIPPFFTQIWGPGDLFFVNTMTLETRFLDLSYTMGEDLTLTVGAGIFLGGELQEELGYSDLAKNNYGNIGIAVVDENIQGKALAGGSNFLIVGYDFFGLELLVGVRQYNLRFRLGDSEFLRTNASSTRPTERFDFIFLQTIVGLGLTF